jgi:hypothetical protein
MLLDRERHVQLLAALVGNSDIFKPVFLPSGQLAPSAHIYARTFMSDVAAFSEYDDLAHIAESVNGSVIALCSDSVREMFELADFSNIRVAHQCKNRTPTRFVPTPITLGARGSGQ